MRADWLVRVETGAPRFDSTAKPDASPALLAARLAARLEARAARATRPSSPTAPAERPRPRA